MDQTLRSELVPQTYAYGKAFEHFIVLELWRLNQLREKDYRFSYLRTKDQAEIDVIIERPGQSDVLVEIKSKQHVDERDVKTLARFVPDFKHAKAYVFSNDPDVKQYGPVKAVPWSVGLAEIGLVKP